MTKKKRGSAIPPEKRKEWLECYKIKGDSPKKIAVDEQVDVRTVRKYIEIAQREEEVHEAKITALRNAVEAHYRDLCKFAEELDNRVKRSEDIPESIRSEPMWNALNKHLPRYPLWQNIGRWQALHKEITSIESLLKEWIHKFVEEKFPLNFSGKPHEAGISSEIITSCLYHIREIADGRTGLDYEKGFKQDSPDAKTKWIYLDSFTIGRVRNEKVGMIKEMTSQLIKEISNIKEYNELLDLLTELKRHQQSLHDELLIITLRRVVPGQCMYCPM